MRRGVTALVICLVAAAGLPAQGPHPETTTPSPPPTFATEVELVTVDVVVVDKQSGAPVRGLRPEDFTLSDGGARQVISSFEPVELSESRRTHAAVRERVSTNADPALRAGRTFAVIFDGLHLSPQGAAAARKAIADFVTTQVRDDDYLMLVGTQAATWITARAGSARQALLSALARQQGVMASELDLDYMSEYEALRIDEYKDVATAMRVTRRWRESGHLPPRHDEESDTDRRGTTAIDLLVGTQARELRRQAAVRQRTTLEALQRVIASLAMLRGRKSVLLVSEGFVFDIGVLEYRAVNLASRRANAAIYFLDARGLEGLSEVLSAAWQSAIDPRDAYDFMAEHSLASDGAQSVALDSGGFAILSTNDLAAGMARIARETEAYYLLGYYPAHARRDGKFHPITVEVNRRDVEVRARRGYYAPGGKTETPRAKGAPERPFQEALDSPFDIGDVPLRMSAFTFSLEAPGKVKAVVLTEVDLRDFRFEEREERLRDALQILLVVSGRDGAAPLRHDQRFELMFREETRAQMATYGFPILREFDLAPGEYEAKIVVQELNAGRMGSLTHPFVVPVPEGLRISTPIVTDTLRPASEGAPAGAAMVARRHFSSAGPLACQFEVYGAERDATTGLARLAVSYAVTLPDGTLFAEGPRQILEGADPALTHLAAFSLAPFPPGEYRLVLRVRDERSGRELERVEPFVVVAGEPPTAASSSRAPSPEQR